jgi:hypothetical protein
MGKNIYMDREIPMNANGSRMSRRLGFWKSIVSYVTKITKKSNRPNFHPNPIFGYAMLVAGKIFQRSIFVLLRSVSPNEFQAK